MNCVCIYCKFNHQTTPFYDSYQFFIQFVCTSLFNKLIPVVLSFFMYIGLAISYVVHLMKSKDFLVLFTQYCILTDFVMIKTLF